MSAKIERHYNAGNHRASERGFSLIELLVVVAVILIIAAIAIPNYLQAKMRANESSAVQNLHIITTAEVVYTTTYEMGFTDTLAKLGGATCTAPDQNNACLIDPVLATGTKSGYVVTYTVVSTDSAGQVTDYSLNADPISVGVTGQRHFYTDQTSVIRWNVSAVAGPSDAPIQ